jgi:hypothetical protein
MPAQVRFGPIRLEHPLEILWYLAEEPNLWQLPHIAIHGAGSYEEPAVIELKNAKDRQAPWLREIYEYAAHSTSLHPPLLHAYLTSEGAETSEPTGGIELGGQLYRFCEATPFLLESTVYLTTPDVSSSMGRCFWIESALHLGIADSIAGRRTDSVYVEFSTLDFVYPRDPIDLGMSGVPRAVWIVRRELEYAVRLYLYGPTGPFHYVVQLRFNPESGKYEWHDHRPTAVRPAIRGQGQDPDAPFLQALKALFVVLTLLRDTSPGFKPPVIHHSGSDIVYKGKPMRILVPPGELEPQRAAVNRPNTEPYLIPRS